MTTYAEYVRRALSYTDDVCEAVVCAELAAQLAMPGNIEYSETSPGPDWVYLGEGERGGKKWQYKGQPGQEEQAAPQQPAPQQTPTPSGKWTPDEYRLDQYLASTGKGMTIRQIEKATGMKGDAAANAIAALRDKDRIAFGASRYGPVYARKEPGEVLQDRVEDTSPVIQTPRQLQQERPAPQPVAESIQSAMRTILQDESAHSQGMMSLYRIRKEIAEKYGLTDREQVDEALQQLRREGKIRLIESSHSGGTGESGLTTHKDTPDEIVEGSIRVPNVEPMFPDRLIAYAEFKQEFSVSSAGGVVGNLSNDLSLSSLWENPTLPPADVDELLAVFVGARFGYVQLRDGSTGWAGKTPPGNSGDWYVAYKGPQEGVFWKRKPNAPAGQKPPPQQRRVAPGGVQQSPQSPPQKQQVQQSGQQRQQNAQPQKAQAAPIPQHAAPVSQLMQKSLAADSKLTPLQKAKYQAATDSVLRAMPEVAQKRVAAHLKKVSLFATNEELTADVDEKYKDDPKWENRTKQGKIVYGTYTLSTGEWRADGESEHEDEIVSGKRSTVHETYAHELTHSIDGPNKELSTSKEWQMAYDAELAGGNLSYYARKSATEGLAEFGRILYCGVADEETLKQFFPRCVKFFQSKGLMHGGTQETAVEELEPPDPMFDDLPDPIFDEPPQPKTPRQLQEVLLMAKGWGAEEEEVEPEIPHEALPAFPGGPPPVEPGKVRLYRGTKKGTLPGGYTFWSDERGLKGVAGAFSKAEGRHLVYVDVPEEVAKRSLQSGAVTEGEYTNIPEEYRRKIREMS